MQRKGKKVRKSFHDNAEKVIWNEILRFIKSNTNEMLSLNKTYINNIKYNGFIRIKSLSINTFIGTHNLTMTATYYNANGKECQLNFESPLKIKKTINNKFN